MCCGKHTTPGQPKKTPTLILPTRRPDTEETPATRPWLQPHPGVSQAHLKTVQLAMFLFLMASSCPTAPFTSLWPMVRQDTHTAVTLHLHPQTRALHSWEPWRKTHAPLATVPRISPEQPKENSPSTCRSTTQERVPSGSSIQKQQRQSNGNNRWAVSNAYSGKGALP